jgi:hypothetical protein
MDVELRGQLINIFIIIFGAVAIGFVLRNVLKVAWKITRITVVLFILIVLLGSLLGWIKLPY